MINFLMCKSAIWKIDKKLKFIFETQTDTYAHSDKNELKGKKFAINFEDIFPRITSGKNLKRFYENKNRYS